MVVVLIARYSDVEWWGWGGGGGEWRDNGTGGEIERERGREVRGETPARERSEEVLVEGE